MGGQSVPVEDLLIWVILGERVSGPNFDWYSTPTDLSVTKQLGNKPSPKGPFALLVQLRFDQTLLRLLPLNRQLAKIRGKIGGNSTQSFNAATSAIKVWVAIIITLTSSKVGESWCWVPAFGFQFEATFFAPAFFQGAKFYPRVTLPPTTSRTFSIKARKHLAYLPFCFKPGCVAHMHLQYYGLLSARCWILFVICPAIYLLILDVPLRRENTFVVRTFCQHITASLLCRDKFLSETQVSVSSLEAVRGSEFHAEVQTKRRTASCLFEPGPQQSYTSLCMPLMKHVVSHVL